jgi:type VI secretion system secreted protein Hcp
MAVDYFLKIDGVDGESTDDKHKDEIEVESFSWGVSQTGTRSTDGGGGAGKVQLHDFNFTKVVSKASPKLFLACASGQHIKQAVFVGRTASNERGGNQFLKYTFSDILVSRYQEAGSVGGDVMDAAALKYASVKTEATPGAIVGVRPEATGNIMLDPNTGQPTVVEGQTGVLLSGPVVNADGILIGLSRGISEFSLDDVLGLIGGPSPHMRLVLTLQEVRSLNEPPVETNVAAAAPDLVMAESSDEDKQKKPKKNTLRHNIYWYAPADLELTADDFGRKGKRLDRVQLDPDGDPLQQEFDLTEIVLEGGFDSIGIRIQSAMDRAKPGGEDDDQNEDEAEGESAESRAAARNATAFLLALEAVAD